VLCLGEASFKYLVLCSQILEIGTRWLIRFFMLFGKNIETKGFVMKQEWLRDNEQLRKRVPVCVISSANGFLGKILIFI